jgi:hypothetical protein
VRAGLKNDDGRSRGAIGSIYGKLSYEQLKPLLPAIYEAIVTPSPSGIMFSDGIRLAGINLLAKHRIQEGMLLCLELMDIHRWNKNRRIMSNLKTLKSYGPAAKAVLPEMRKLLAELKKHREKKMLAEHINYLGEMIATLEKVEGELEPLRSIKH